MKYILAISLVSLLALTSCFEKKIPDPIVEDDTMTSEDVLIEDNTSPMMEDDRMMDDGMMMEDDTTTSANNDADTTVTVENETMTDDEIEMYEEDLEALFQDILGE